jgi:hypothetical protein
MENEFLLTPRRIEGGGACAPAHWRGSRRVAIIAALGVVLVFGHPSAAAAAEFLLRVGDIQVPAGTAVHGAAIAVGGTVYVDGIVEGDAIALGGDVDVRGHVAGSARADGGSVILHSTAVVDGEAAAFGGTVVREPGARVGGRRSEPAPPGPVSPSTDLRGLVALAGGLMVLMKPLLWLMYVFLLAGLVGSAWMMAVLFPRAIARFGVVLERDPVGAFLAGLLGWPVSFVVVVLLAVSVVGLTLVLLVPTILIAAVTFGTAAVALVIGRRLRPAGTVQEVVIGAVILAIVVSIPGVGWVVGLVVATWGLGAVLLAFMEGRRSEPARPAAPL